MNVLQLHEFKLTFIKLLNKKQQKKQKVKNGTEKLADIQAETEV